MSTIKRSKTDAFSVKESVNIVKLAEAAFEQISLDQLTDVVVETPTDGDILVYSSDLMAWENVPQAGLNYDLEDLDNITITSVSDGQVLTWDSGTSKWVNGEPAVGSSPSGSDMHVQYNDSGVFGGNPNLTFNDSTNTLTATNIVAESISGSKTIVTEAGSSRTITNDEAGKYIRFTGTGAKTCTFGLTITKGEYRIRNAAASGDVTLTAASTILNAPADGTLVLAPGMTATVKFISTATFDVDGQTVPA